MGIRNKSRLECAVFLSLAVVYISCASGAIGARDCADMASAAFTLGVAHPPGYPLYSVLGHAWISTLPFGNPAYRLAVLSALAAAGAATLLFGVMRRRCGLLAGVVAAAAWAFSAPLWKFALLQEKYALHALFAAALLALTPIDSETAQRRARLSGLLAGLALVNHQSFIFWILGLAWLWRGECVRLRIHWMPLIQSAASWLIIGLALNVFLWIRLGDVHAAWETLIRSRYGSTTLFAGFAAPLALDRALDLAAWSMKEWAKAVGLPLAGAALYGLWREWRAKPGWIGGLLIGALASGPLFVVLSRFDASNWVARSILEPAFLLPTLVLAIGVGVAVASFQNPFHNRIVASVLLALVALGGLGRLVHRRDDFLAYDYVRNLRRAVPPGGLLLAAGDTALFGLRWLDLTEPTASIRSVSGVGLTNISAWIAAASGKSDAFICGVGPSQLAAHNLPSPTHSLAPEGLVCRLNATSAMASAPIILRKSATWEHDDSYARDAKLSYAFASWSAARILEAQGVRPPMKLDMTAVILDPEDYRIE